VYVCMYVCMYVQMDFGIVLRVRGLIELLTSKPTGKNQKRYLIWGRGGRNQLISKLAAVLPFCG
jgi:hypothetical protein